MKLLPLLLLLLIFPVTAGECHNNDGNNISYCQINNNITSEWKANIINNLTYYINQTLYFDNIHKSNLTALCNYNATMPYNIHFKYGLISITGCDYPIHNEYTQSGYLIIMVHYNG